MCLSNKALYINIFNAMTKSSVLQYASSSLKSISDASNLGGGFVKHVLSSHTFHPVCVLNQTGVSNALKIQPTYKPHVTVAIWQVCCYEGSMQ